MKLRKKTRCLDGGYLVGGRHPVPRDSAELYADRTGAIVGCNRLRCLRCGRMVWQEQSGGARRYLCICAGWLESSARPTSVLGADGAYDDAALPWRCAGHPGTTRPISSPDGDLPDLPASDAWDSGA